MLASQIKTSSDLRAFVENAKHDSHFFSRQTMRFFGDTMANYGVRRVTIRVRYDTNGDYVSADGVEIEAFELYRRRPVKAGNQKSAYFRADTFRQTFPISET